ncbi:MAG TPA: hypothetical protein VFI29_23760 [Hanamia sp.]|nr:hypothetical protein [Hanamia sp.]
MMRLLSMRRTGSFAEGLIKTKKIIGSFQHINSIASKKMNQLA